MQRNSGVSYANKVLTGGPALSATGSGNIAVYKSDETNHAPAFLRPRGLLRDG